MVGPDIISSEAETDVGALRTAGLEPLIRLDQLIATRRSARIAIPVNSILSLACMLVACHHGQQAAGLAWFLASTVVNAFRVALYYRSSPANGYSADKIVPRRDVDRHLRLAWVVTLLSGIVWSTIPMLCAGYTGPQTLFYLVVECGITAGAVTHGIAYARVPIAFILPPILSAVLCLLYVGGYDRDWLAATMVLYFGALLFTARQAERGFRRSSRLQHEATAMALSLRAAHARSLGLAEEMRHRATHDILTGVLNRAGFLQEAGAFLRGGTVPVCLMLLDLDGFKAINDVFGHKVGDDVLVEVAARLRRLLPEGIVIARFGGDEFALLYTAAPASELPSLLANRLIAEVGLPYTAFGAATRVGVSVGIHVAQDADMTEMLSCADEALYAAKSAGRNRHYLFDAILRTRLTMRRDVERDLARALIDRSVEIWFQPIYGSGGRVVSSFEALIRWQHPTHGWIPPAELMATAANAGFAEPLMDFILSQVCLMIEVLRAQGLDHICVAMNVSPREMSQLPVDDVILAALASRGLPPAMIEVEITEETALDIASVQRKLAALSNAGIRITVDDFGVGYSSLASLRHLNVDRIKIDRCFISGLAHSDGDQVVVQAILQLGRSLGFEVVAEGIETADDFEMLQGFGCRFMQGYHLGHPMPMDQSLDLASRPGRSPFAALQPSPGGTIMAHDPPGGRGGA